MDISSIAAASVYMHQNQTKQAVDIAMLKKTMDSQEVAATSLIESFKEMVPPPSFGYKLNIKV